MITNHKYHIDGMTDLAKIREEAIRQSRDTRFGPAPRIVLHKHRQGDCGNTPVKDFHEVYVNGQEVHYDGE